MDLIYTDKNGIDKNIMPTYELDAAFGRDENDFECRLQSKIIAVRHRIGST